MLNDAETRAELEALRQIQDYCDLGLPLFLHSNRWEHLVKLVDDVLGGETAEDRWGGSRQAPEGRETMKLDLSEATKKELAAKEEKLKIELAKLEGTHDALEEEIEILSKLSTAVKTIIDNHNAGDL